MLRLVLYCVLAFAVLSGCGGGPITEAKASPPRLLTVVIGDSLTAGYIPTSGVLQLRQDLSYTADLAPIGDVVTAAVGGATTAAVLGTQVPWLRGLPADVVVITIGANDAIQGLDRGQALLNVTKIADTWPRAKLVLVAPPRVGMAADAWLLAWAADLQALANSRGAQFVDAYAASRAEWLCLPPDPHPCAPAHREMGALVRGAIEVGGR